MHDSSFLNSVRSRNTCSLNRIANIPACSLSGANSVVSLKFIEQSSIRVRDMSTEKCKQSATAASYNISANNSLPSTAHVDSSQLKAGPALVKEETVERRVCRSKNHRASPYDRANGSSSSGKSSPTTTNNGSSDESSGEVVSDHLHPEETKHKRVSANKRERSRMHTVNEAFDSLRELVPTYPSNRKLSKIETLRLACSYIEDLAKLLHESPPVHARGDDVTLYDKNFTAFPPYHPSIDGNSVHHLYPAMMKSEYVSQDYSPCYQHYRVPYAGSDCESCNSEPDVPSSPYSVRTGSPGIAVRPLALARVSSDSGVAMQMATASLSGTSSPVYNSPIPTPCSPLTRVHHTTPPSLSHSHQSSIFTPRQITMAPIASWQRTAHFSPPACCYSQ